MGSRLSKDLVDYNKETSRLARLRLGKAAFGKSGASQEMARLKEWRVSRNDASQEWRVSGKWRFKRGVS